MKLSKLNFFLGKNIPARANRNYIPSHIVVTKNLVFYPIFYLGFNFGNLAINLDTVRQNNLVIKHYTLKKSNYQFLIETLTSYGYILCK